MRKHGRQRPGTRRTRRVVAAVAAVAVMAMVVASCASLPAGLGGTIADPRGGDPIPLGAGFGPELVRGIVVDEAGRPVRDALVVLTLEPSPADLAKLQPGEAVPSTSLRAVRSDQAGRFVFHLEVDERVWRAAQANAGGATFSLQAFERWPLEDGDAVGVWMFPVTVASDGSLSDLPGPVTVTLQDLMSGG